MIRGTDCHPTAAWVYEEMKRVFTNLSKGTVYRNINILVDQQLIQRIEAGSSSDRFDGNVEPHFHFFCKSCSAVEDLPLKPIKELKSIATSLPGYSVENYRIDFQGLCPKCQEQPTKKKRPDKERSLEMSV